MKIETIELRDWRSFESASFQFSPGMNFVYGPNGLGKTNLLESIAYLSFARSFRHSQDRDLIRNSCTKAEVCGIFTSEGDRYTRKVEAVVTPKGKQIRVDDSKARTLSSFAGTVLTKVFEPKSVFLFKDEPSERRKLIDETLCSMDPKYLYSLQRYRKVLRERNQALITQADDEVMMILTNELVRISYPIVQGRLSLIRSLDDVGNTYFKKLFDTESKLRFAYRTNAMVDDDQMAYQDRMLAQFEREKSRERIRRATLIGPHRDDLVAYLDDKSLGAHGSQGQNRLASLSVTLALASLVRDRKGNDPILILDDVLSDLDKDKQQRLLDTVGEFQQAIISGSVLEDLPKGSNLIDIGEMRRNEMEGGR